MKYLLLIGLVTFTSCSSTPQNKIDSQNELVVEHMAKGKKVIGQDFDSKFQKDGLIGGEYLAIAAITDNADKNDRMLQVLAEGLFYVICLLL